MAITIEQSPSKLNAAYTNLIYTVDSDQYTQPQFQYVMDIVSGSETLSRIRQYPNPKGKAVFDPSKIIKDYVEYQEVDIHGMNDIDELQTSPTDPINNANAREQIGYFSIRFGEEYGPSISSSVYMYDGLGGIGTPAKTSSIDPLDIIPALVDYNDNFQNITGAGFNFYTGSRLSYYGDSPEDTNTYTYNKFFTTQPYSNSSIGTVRKDSNIGIAYNDQAFIQAVVSQSVDTSVTVDVQGFNSSGGSTFSDSVTLTGLTFPAVVTIPISPRQQGYSQAQFDLTERFTTDLSSPGVDVFQIFKDNEACNYERLSIQFINKLGMWDFYGFSLPSDERVNIDRESYQKPFVDWSTSRDSNQLSNFNSERRGTTLYNVSKSKTLRFTTPYLSQAQASHVEQIFDSPEVSITYDNQNLNNQQERTPVIVTNNSYVRNTNIKGQKLFQYTFDFELSNNPTGR